MLRPLAVLVVIASFAAAEVPAPAPSTPPPTTVITPVPVPAPPPEKERPMPPSPSSVPGVRIWPDPRFSHWPAIVYEDESRNCSFELPVKKAGTPGSIAWEGAKPLPFVLPKETDRISGLIDLPRALGTATAVVTLEGKEHRLRLRLADARQPWPLAKLVDGFPVDAEGVPVVLVDRRRDPGSERKWAALAGKLARPGGRPLIVGDPLEAMGEDAWKDLDAEKRPALDERYPHHAVLVALANLPKELPRTIVWCPGNQALFGGAWSQEEERVLAAVRSRCEAAEALPDLVLVLPPVPVDNELRELAAKRREQLQESATFLGWRVLDAEREVGPAEEANRVSPGVYTRYPLGQAQERLRAAIRGML